MDSNKRPDSMARINTVELANAFIEEQVAAVRAQVGDKKVLLALSGGVDSSVVAALLIKAIGKQLVCVHVNHGLMRKGESEQVIEVFGKALDANLVYVDAVDRFLDNGVMKRLNVLYIIHGKGTGALRKGVHDYLRRQKRVASFRLGQYGEGDAGVTIVQLKK